MAVATPVLERKVNNVTPSNNQQAFTSARMYEDEMHNARIKDNFARLINPDSKIGDVLERNQPQAQQPVQSAAPAVAQPHANILYSAQPVISEQPAINAQPVVNNAPYLVENARADASIFRADSLVNRPHRIVNPVIPKAQVVDYVNDEEENEDLRPTQTTIQYKTAEKALADVRVEKTQSVTISKKEKIIIGTFVGIVVMLFALIIINAAIISSLNADISALQTTLQAVQNSAVQLEQQVGEASSAQNVIEYAINNGMILVGGN